MLSHGDGVYIYSASGERFLNGCSSLWNLALGLGREELAEVAARQMRELAYSTCFGHAHPRAMELAARLVELTDGQYDRVYLGSNGSEAVEAALKIARQYFRQSPRPEEREKFKILALRGSYHGTGFGAISASGDQLDQKKYGPLLEGFAQIEPPYCYRCPYGQARYPECGLKCAEALREKILEEKPETVAAFIVEPVMGVLGTVVPPPEYFARVGEICRDNGVLLIADEVTTGFGRTGRLFASQTWEPRPDLLVLGKGISSGYLPLSATLATAEVQARFRRAGEQLDHGSTASGHPVCAAVGLATIEILVREKLPERAQAMGRLLEAGLNAIADESSVIGEIRGAGLMWGLELVADRQTREPLAAGDTGRHMADLASLGLLLSRHENVLCLLPPLVISEEAVEELLGILAQGLGTGWSARLGRGGRMVQRKTRRLLGGKAKKS